MKKTLLQLFFQIIPVMIGVYLGLLTSNWADDRKMRSQTELLRKNLVAEIETNKNRIESVIEYHEMLRDSSRHYTREENLGKQPNFFSGVRPSILTQTAFETGIQTGLINGLEFKEIQFLNHVYTIQNSYADFSKMMLTGLITMDSNEDPQGRTKLFRYLSTGMTDIVFMEQQLLKEYEGILRKLDKR